MCPSNLIVTGQEPLYGDGLAPSDTLKAFAVAGAGSPNNASAKIPARHRRDVDLISTPELVSWHGASSPDSDERKARVHGNPRAEIRIAGFVSDEVVVAATS